MKSLVVAVLAVVVLAAPSVALVVGNSTYAHIGRLPHPDNDARDVSAALQRLGFEVTTEPDTDRLRERGHDPQTVAHFVNRLVFCMFADDVGLLPGHMFTRMLRHARPVPERFTELAGDLFEVMATGGLDSGRTDLG